MSQDTRALAEAAVRESIAAKQALLKDEVLMHLIVALCGEFVTALKNGRKIILFGNGGSAADAQHIAAEFVGRYLLERRALPAIALATNTSTLTGIGNDYAFDEVFARQVEAFGVAGDIAVGISTSGRSTNVLKGIAAANRKGLVTLALTGKSGGKLKGEAKYCICVPAEVTARIQEVHILIGHILSELTEKELFPAAPRGAAKQDLPSPGKP